VAFNELLDTLFKRRVSEESHSPTRLVGPRIPRHSSGWAAMLKHLKSETGFRLLDFGPTSSSNINLLTSMGHSLYMADIVSEAQGTQWLLPSEDGTAPGVFDAGSFLQQNLDLGGRIFDVVLLWTTLDYLPEGLLVPLIERLRESISTEGQILAFFHTPATESDRTFYRYHVTEGDSVELQGAESVPLKHVFTNRKIEKLFSGFRYCKFFLAKDGVSEVIVTR
jgi:phospholipid N-methyltransferase